MKPTETMFVIRWWSRSAVSTMEDITLNPSEYRNLLNLSGDAVNIRVWSVADLLEILDDNDPRND